MAGTGFKRQSGLLLGACFYPQSRHPPGKGGGQQWALGSLSSFEPQGTEVLLLTHGPVCMNWCLLLPYNALGTLTGASYTPLSPGLTILWVTSPFCLRRRWCSERIKPLTTAIELGLQHRTLYLCPLALPPREGKTKGGRTHLDGRHCAKCFSTEHSWTWTWRVWVPTHLAYLLAVSQPVNLCVKWVLW